MRSPASSVIANIIEEQVMITKVLLGLCASGKIFLL
jgi:hypothetical protein